MTAEPSIAELLAARPGFAMHAQDGLCFENVPLNAIADAHGTPVWVYGGWDDPGPVCGAGGGVWGCRVGAAYSLCGEGE